jgi:hypothetical protein
MATNSTNFDPITLATFQGYTVRSELSSRDHLSHRFDRLVDRHLPSHLVLLRQFLLLVATSFDIWMERLKEKCHLQLLISHIGTVRDHIGDYCASWLIKSTCFGLAQVAKRQIAKTCLYWLVQFLSLLLSLSR